MASTADSKAFPVASRAERLIVPPVDCAGCAKLSSGSCSDRWPLSRPGRNGRFISVPFLPETKHRPGRHHGESRGGVEAGRWRFRGLYDRPEIFGAEVIIEFG